MSGNDLSYTRAYRPTEGRQQRNDKLVHDVVELRRAIQDAAQIERPLNVRLAATILLEAPITIPSTVPAFHLNGGDLFGFLWPQTIFAAFIVGGSSTSVVLADCSFGTTVDGNAQCAALVSATAGVTVNGLRLRNLDVLRVSDVLDPTVDWVDVNGTELRLRGSLSHQMSLRATTGSIVASNFANALGSCTVVFPATSTDNKLVDFNDGVTGLAALQSAGGNSFLGVTFGGGVTLGATDLFVGGPDAPAQFPNGTTEQTTVNGTGTTSGAVSITVAQFTPSPSKSYLVTMRMIGRRTNGTDPGQTDVWVIAQVFKVSSAGAVTVGAIVTNNNALDDGTWAAAMDTSGGVIRMRAAGVAAQNITWATHTSVVEA